MSEREYNSQYNLNRYHRRRQEMITILGGVCVVCNTTDELQIDHKDPKEKSFELSEQWSKPWHLIVEELTKCQLLCRPHHIEKTLSNADAGRYAAQHGSISMYRHRKCRCDECVKVNREYNRKFY